MEIFLHLKEEGTKKRTTTSNKARISKSVEKLRDYKKSKFPDFKSFFETNRKKRTRFCFFFKQKLYMSSFSIDEIPPCKYEVSDINNTLHSFIKTYYTIDFVTKIFKIKTHNVLQFDETSFFYTVLGVTLYWDCKPKVQFFCQNQVRKTSKDEINLKFDAIFRSFIYCVRVSKKFSFAVSKPPGF